MVTVTVTVIMVQIGEISVSSLPAPLPVSDDCQTVIIRVKRDPVTIVIHILMFHGGGPASAIKELPDGICSRLINEVLL